MWVSRSSNADILPKAHATNNALLNSIPITTVSGFLVVRACGIPLACCSVHAAPRQAAPPSGPRSAAWSACSCLIVHANDCRLCPCSPLRVCAPSGCCWVICPPCTQRAVAAAMLSTRLASRRPSAKVILSDVKLAGSLAGAATVLADEVEAHSVHRRGSQRPRLGGSIQFQKA